MEGREIFHYRVLEYLGGGGMGSVYKALDTKLNRSVALKFLRKDLTKEPEARKRFLLEAQSASILDHPNICTIHRIDQTTDGQIFIGMSYYKGRTLKDIIKDGPMSIDKAVGLALQFSSGLIKAHALGIIHRDLKPSNIIVTDEGIVKILDFGLAKLIGIARLTKTGMTVGTAHYMSPEQAKAVDKIDSRTDIWSIGVILFEMITGKTPFSPNAEIDPIILRSVIEDETPSLTSKRSDVPLELEEIILTCLEKDPELRYQSMADLHAELKRYERDTSSRITRGYSSSKEIKKLRSKFRMHLVFEFILLFLALALFYFILQQHNPTEPQISSVTKTMGLTDYPSWSHDGKWIIYSSENSKGDMDLWKSHPDGSNAVRITSSSKNEIQPCFSPDSKSIAYSLGGTKGGIYLISSSTENLEINPSPYVEFGSNPRWSPDGQNITFDWKGNIYIVQTNRSRPEPQELVVGTGDIPHQTWNADGRRIYFWHNINGAVYFVDIQSKTQSKALGLITEDGFEISGLSIPMSTGNKIFFCVGRFGGNKDMYNCDIDSESGMPVGQPRKLTSAISDDINCSVSPDGQHVVFTVSRLERHLFKLPIDPINGKALDLDSESIGIQLTYRGYRNYYPSYCDSSNRLIFTSHLGSQGKLYTMDFDDHYYVPVTDYWDSREISGSISSSGEIVFASDRGGEYEIWIKRKNDNIPNKLTEIVRESSAIEKSRFRDTMPVWSPSGNKVAFNSNRGGDWNIWLIDLDNEFELKNLTKSFNSDELLPSWSPDGRYIAFKSNKDGNDNIYRIDLNNPNLSPSLFVRKRANGTEWGGENGSEEFWSAWSADGERFYFTSNYNGNFDIWMISNNADEWTKITNFSKFSISLPRSGLYTKFSVSENGLILPVDFRTGDIYLLTGFQ